MSKNTQQTTGDTTENEVAEELRKEEIEVFKPIPDNGIDLVAYLPNSPDKKINIQVKGRGKAQSNKRYRWFQLRTTAAQRQKAIDDGLGAENAWQNKVEKCDFFVLVSLYHGEKWVFSKSEISDIIRKNKQVYGNRADNINGKQVEMDLDIEINGSPLTSIYERNRNNFAPVIEAVKGKQREIHIN